jgi:hypothetical protein
MKTNYSLYAKKQKKATLMGLFGLAYFRAYER